MVDDIAARARRRTAAVVAAVAAIVVAAAAIGAGLVVVLGHRHSPAPEPGTAAAPSTVDAAAAESRSTAPSPTVPARLQVPDDLTWTTVAGARVPVSAIAGPRVTTGGRARGFAHSPLGAVLAAAHLSVRLCPQVGPDVFVPTLREQVVGGNAAALAQQLDDDYEQARAQLGLPYGQPAGRLYSIARGYRVDLDSPTSASVRLLIEGPGKAGAAVLVELRVQTQWIGEDWALVAPPGGTWETATALVTDTTGYTRFPDGG
jgi:hypothetical protein